MILLPDTERMPLAVIRRTTQQLEAMDNPCAAKDAELLLAYVIGVEASRLPLQMTPISDEQSSRLQQLIDRRLKGEPVAYIIGVQSFWSLDFIVNEHTLIPRPDTETLVEEGLQAIEGLKNPSILDIGTGTGCVLLSLLAECDAAVGVGVDISPEALVVAKQNAVNNDLSSRVAFHCGNAFTPLDEGRTFDLIVSNPPYIPSADIVGLMMDVRDHEPRLALDGGLDGLDFYRVLARESQAYLNEGGTLAVEVGFDQSQAVIALFHDANYVDIQVKQDLSGIKRVVCAKKYA